MLQSTEYQPGAYLQWLSRTRDFAQVVRRRTLDRTKAAKALLFMIMAGMIFQIVVGVVLVYIGASGHSAALVLCGVATILVYPWVWAYVVTVPLVLGRILIVAPSQKQMIAASEALFAGHPGVKIAVAGSYGKTTMKELLATILSSGKKVAATPANKNVAISHAAFAKKLSGDEDVLIIEYGEGAPGDVAGFARITHPTIGVITGLAPAHLDKYKTLQAAGEDIFTLAAYLKDQNLYVSGESAPLKSFIKPAHHVYNREGVLNWRISDVKVDIRGTAFTMKRSDDVMRLRSSLLGAHQVAPLACAAALARELGLSKQQVEEGVASTYPFEHRMQPRNMGGAWVIDDTYNGNIEGVRAGLQLLKELPAKRKMYVTPGLVDQGAETERVHLELGRLIAEAAPDMVVLMKNSVADFIQTGLQKGSFEGELRIEENPLKFYTNIAHITAAGDVVLMQNDWTDNYA
jgi:UDP-N-acetylmuramoyl-tripeptide--D-alanyl-D-alanine ligase